MIYDTVDSINFISVSVLYSLPSFKMIIGCVSFGHVLQIANTKAVKYNARIWKQNAWLSTLEIIW